MDLDITSPANPKIKWVKSLHKNSTRRNEDVFIVEGIKEISYALDGGYLLQTLFVCPEIYKEDISKLTLDNFFTVSRDIYEKISYRSGTEGLLAVFKAQNKTLESLTFGDNPSFLILESIEKPGNLGAIIRTADGAGIDAVIICDPKCDVFNPNVIRSSVGTVFSKQVVSASNQEVLDFLQNHEITAYAAVLSKDSISYTEADFTSPCALILGTEHLGLSKFWKDNARVINIPMLGSNDSLNVSSAAAVLAYEVIRQRNEKPNHSDLA